MERKHRRLGSIVGVLILLIAGLSGVARPTAASMALNTVTATADILPTPPPIPSPPAKPTAPASVPATALPTEPPTPAANARPDGCEANDTRESPCALGVDAVGGPFTFLPSGDQDYYRIDLGAPNGLATTITVRDAGSLDLLTTISRDDGTPLATIASPIISATLAPHIAGGVIVRVENRSPHDPAGSSYSVEVRRTLPPAPAHTQGEQPALPPDALENNWNVDTAAPIAVGVVYDLNFSCPEGWDGACVGGDHDYLAVPVKARTNYLIASFDLGPGVDTVIDLFWGNHEHPLISNDDHYRAGMLSVIRWHAPANGTAIVRVAPRNGGTTPIVDDTQAGFYRFAIALDGSDLARQLDERTRQQSGMPTPTAASAAPGAGSAPPANGNVPPANGNVPPAPAAPPVAPSAAADAPQGVVVVAAESTVLREGPDAKARAIQTLPQESLVTLTGQVSGSWVRGLPDGGVVPGWLYGPDLHRPSSTAAIPAVPSESGTPLSGGSASGNELVATLAPPTPTPKPRPVVSRLDPAPAPLPPALPGRQTVAVSVTLVVATTPPAPLPGPGMPRPTLVPTPPLAGVRVQLVNAFGDVLIEAVTPQNGTVRLTRDLDSGLALFVRVPAVGLQVPLDLGQPLLTLAIPVGGLP